VFLRGAAIDRRELASLAPWLEPHFSVWAVDRRGRGASDDGPDHAIEREFEDLAAVVDAIGAEANVLGQSYGATVRSARSHSCRGSGAPSSSIRARISAAR
jgi:pimeloyl-ACP methyl ester carboxylesterase